MCDYNFIRIPVILSAYTFIYDHLSQYINLDHLPEPRALAYSPLEMREISNVLGDYLSSIQAVQSNHADEFQTGLMVPQGFWSITQSGWIGTYSLGPCIALVCHEKNSASLFLAHVDYHLSETSISAALENALNSLSINPGESELDITLVGGSNPSGEIADRINNQLELLKDLGYSVSKPNRWLVPNRTIHEFFVRVGSHQKLEFFWKPSDRVIDAGHEPIAKEKTNYYTSITQAINFLTRFNPIYQRPLQQYSDSDSVEPDSRGLRLINQILEEKIDADGVKHLLLTKVNESISSSDTQTFVSQLERIKTFRAQLACLE